MVLSHFRVCGRRQDHVGDVVHQLAVLLGFGTDRQPVGMGGKGIPLLLALSQVLPFEDVVQRVVAFADDSGPETHLAYAEAFP